MDWEPHALNPGTAYEYTSSPLSQSSSSDSAAEDATTENRPFACTYPGCTRRFKRKYTLKDHMNAHTGEKPFVCPVSSCGKSFTTSGNLARHRRLHPWLDTPLPCLVDGCECVFPNDEKLQRHMLSHFDDSGEFRCEIGTCGRVFTTVGNLRRHIKQNHNDTPEAESLKVHPRPSRISPAGDIAPVQAAPSGAALPAPLPYSARVAHQLPSDDEILDTLSCLFDEDSAQSRR
jgi:uncharacterized Zn-finger protein